MSYGAMVTKPLNGLEKSAMFCDAVHTHKASKDNLKLAMERCLIVGGAIRFMAEDGEGKRVEGYGKISYVSLALGEVEVSDEMGRKQLAVSWQDITAIL